MLALLKLLILPEFWKAILVYGPILARIIGLLEKKSQEELKELGENFGKLVKEAKTEEEAFELLRKASSHLRNP